MRVAIALGTIFLGALLVVVLMYRGLHEPIELDTPTTVVIKKGMGQSAILVELHTQFEIPASLLGWKVYALITRQSGALRAGEFAVEPHDTALTLLERLRSGITVQHRMTFPEGRTTEDWMSLIVSSDLLSNNRDRASLWQYINEQFPSVDGYLYPDTYAFDRGTSATELLQRAGGEMQQVLDEALSRHPLPPEIDNRHELLTLASMVEKETGQPSDRGNIASVFLNRLRMGMKLQSDPTIIYGLEDFDGDLKRSHLRADHAYNTYVIDGLPVGPICNPGIHSILAVLNAPETDYLYFVARGDGSSEFSTNLQDHNRAVTRFQKAGRVENYRSTPE